MSYIPNHFSELKCIWFSAVKLRKVKKSVMNTIYIREIQIFLNQCKWTHADWINWWFELKKNDVFSMEMMGEGAVGRVITIVFHHQMYYKFELRKRICHL